LQFQEMETATKPISSKSHNHNCRKKGIYRECYEPRPDWEVVGPPNVFLHPMWGARDTARLRLRLRLLLLLSFFFHFFFLLLLLLLVLFGGTGV
jgi:hypothetical protein